MTASEKKVSAYQSHDHSGILLNANELSDNVDQAVMEEILQAMPDVLFNRYPDNEYTKLKESYAQLAGVEPDMVLCGNGSDQMLGLLIGCAISKGKTLATLEPDFGMYDYYVSMHDGQMKKYAVEPDQPFDMNAFITFCQDCDMILFSNPNNPTGNIVTKEKIRQLLESVTDIPVVIDEAYMDFADESVIPLLNEYKNLFVTRTLSKAYGAAGIRLGFLLGCADNIRKLDALNVPYSVSRTSERIGRILLDHAKEYEQKIERTKQRRDAMVRFGKELEHITIVPSHANFVLVQSERIDRILDAMIKEHVVIREYKEKPYCRITIGSEKENKLVADILRKVDQDA